MNGREGTSPVKDRFFKIFSLNANAIKFIAAFCMAIDHVGVILFPGESIFRIIGRIAFPLFAYMIAEGCEYTRSKLKHVLTMAFFAAICQIFYFVFMGDEYMSIFVTFTLAVLLIYALQLFKNTLFSDKPIFIKILTGALFFGAVAGAYVINRVVDMDYGFAGCVLPLVPSAFRKPKGAEGNIWKWIDNKYIRIAAFAVGLAVFSASSVTRQWFSLASIPFLLLYSEKKGKLKTKYFFYFFYPLHLVLIFGIYVLIRIIQRAA